jgi:hypothetical protein
MVLPKDATLYCPNCMAEQKVNEGNFKSGLLPLFCNSCKKQISELLLTESGWQLHKCFYKNSVVSKKTEKPQ